jgi:hypothetical protein
MNDNSKEAFNNIKPRLGLIQEQIMSHLPTIRMYRRHGSFVFTYSPLFPQYSLVGIGYGTSMAIAIATGLSEEQCRKRMSELERAGFVKRSEHKYTYIGSDGRRYSKTIWMAVNNEI